jgi:hypothetical protein
MSTLEHLFSTHVDSVTDGGGRRSQNLIAADPILQRADHEASFAFCRGTFCAPSVHSTVTCPIGRSDDLTNALRHGRGLPFKILTHRTVPPQPQKRRCLTEPVSHFSTHRPGIRCQKAYVHLSAQFIIRKAEWSIYLANDRRDIVLVGAIDSLVSIASSSVFPTLRLGGGIASPNLTVYTLVVYNSPEHLMKSSVPTGPHPSPRTAADCSARRISDRFFPNAIDLVNETLCLTDPDEVGRQNS